MNAFLPAALLVLVLSGTWLLGRRRSRPFLRSTDTSDVVALNRAQIERLREQQRPAAHAVLSPEASPMAPASLDSSSAPLQIRPAPTRPRPEHLRQLQVSLSGSREQRLDAIAVAHRLKHRSVLPLLRRALRDPDPAVVAVAAAAMERYRGRTAAAQASPSENQPLRGRAQAGTAAEPRLPRNVSRTR